MKKLNLLLILVSLFHLSFAQNTVDLNKWNISNTQRIPMPAFSDVQNIEGTTFKKADLLEQTLLNSNSKFLTWKTIEIGSDSMALNLSEENNLVFIESHLSVDQWTKGKLKLAINAVCEIYLDGKLVKTKKNADLTMTSVAMELSRGNHKITLKALTADEPLKLKSGFEYGDDFANCNAAPNLNSKRLYIIHDVLEGTRVSSANISPSGKYVLITYSEVIAGSGKTKKFTEIYKLEDQQNFITLRNLSISNVKWLPKTDRLSYSTKTGDEYELFVLNIEQGEEKSIASGIKDLAGYTWSPNEDFIVFTTYLTSDKPGDLKRIYGNEDRLPYFRNRSFLSKIDVKTGKINPITAGNLSSSLHDINPHEPKILFSTSRMDYSEVPFRKQNLYELNVRTNELSVIWEDKIYSGSCQYSPDGNKLLVQGGPECFGKLGVNVSEGRIPNSYDSQLYIYDLASKKVEPITKEFDPAINQAFWTKNDELYVSVTDKDYGNFYQYNFKTKSFSKIDLMVEVIDDIDIAKDEAVAVYTGTSISTPKKLYALNLKKGSSELISFPEKDRFADIQFGKTEPWNFTNKNGTTIYGRIYYPPNYDSSKKYPVIVNFYGGTSPIERSFGGRYPINNWAAHGYIVYVLQPSGATGFGQDFSSLHVNGWGFDAIKDIIEGTEKFLDSHTNADSENVGCIGASYGGYTTMLLQTRTDLFKTAISHAGISSITSYWGEGYWGYSYNTGAAKFSYPWNRKDIFVDNSPIYNADKFNNSILLLHGTADTNVPVGESLQYYAALKLLGKDVEMVLVDGQDHWILDYQKRIKWHHTIISWFDKKLKDQPQQWNDLYPEKNL